MTGTTGGRAMPEDANNAVRTVLQQAEGQPLATDEIADRLSPLYSKDQVRRALEYTGRADVVGVIELPDDKWVVPFCPG
jgi:hypothetical protein